jgi:NADPH:quinone reductase-like Zn-dependent oxidoreductase
VLVTGIGGGVALYALQFSVAAGANVYVTSSKEDKIQRAIEMGAKGGVNYRKGIN